MTFTNKVRKLLGLTVRRGRAGNRPRAFQPPSSGAKAVLNGASGLTYDTIDRLAVGQGVLLPPSQWKHRFANFDSAEASIRQRHPTIRFSVRRVLTRGRGQSDMLVLRLK